MSPLITKATDYVNAKLSERSFDGNIRIRIEDAGEIIVDSTGARPASQPGQNSQQAGHECLVTTDQATFSAVLDGHLDPMTAYLSGRLQVKGDMGAIARFGNALRSR